jgi:hypothetical protein
MIPQADSPAHDFRSAPPSEEELAKAVRRVCQFECFANAIPQALKMERENKQRYALMKQFIGKIEILLLKRPGTLLRSDAQTAEVERLAMIFLDARGNIEVRTQKTSNKRDTKQKASAIASTNKKETERLTKEQRRKERSQGIKKGWHKSELHAVDKSKRLKRASLVLGLARPRNTNWNERDKASSGAFKRIGQPDEGEGAQLPVLPRNVKRGVKAEQVSDRISEKRRKQGAKVRASFSALPRLEEGTQEKENMRSRLLKFSRQMVVANRNKVTKRQPRRLSQSLPAL